MRTNENEIRIPTLYEAFEHYLRDRRDLRPTTVLSYRDVIKRAGWLLAIPITEIKYSDIKQLYSRLRYDMDYKPASIELLNSVLLPVFNLAVRDEIIRVNPVKGVYKEVARGPAWKIHHRSAVDEETKEKFLNFIHLSPEYRRWENFFIFLFGTGIRIGEAIALRWEDVDFLNKEINIKRAVYYRNGTYFEGPPKSEAGIRTIPMLTDVMEALLRENQIARLTKALKDGNVPGEKGLVFVSSKGTMLYAGTVNNAIKNIVAAYNRQNPDKLTNFSVHQIRHSFCTMLCEKDVNVKVIQSVMGHSDFDTTMNIYAEVSENKKKEAFLELEKRGVV